MQLHKLAHNYMSLHAVTWACMQLLELACSSLSFQEVPWGCMQFHKLACSSISLHAVPRASMQFHDLVCCCSLSLSSSQEFRSACYPRKWSIHKVKLWEPLWEWSKSHHKLILVSHNKLINTMSNLTGKVTAAVIFAMSNCEEVECTFI